MFWLEMIDSNVVNPKPKGKQTLLRLPSESWRICPVSVGSLEVIDEIF